MNKLLADWQYQRLEADAVLIHLTIPGEPVPKARPRFDGRRTYTPARTRAAEETLAWAVRSTHPGLRPDRVHRLGVWLHFRVRNHRRRDADNLQKLVLDACNGLVWGDDSQIDEVVCRVERGSDEPGTDILVYRLSGPQGGGGGIA